MQNGAVETDGVITWDGDLSGEKEFVFTALVDYDPSGYGQPITNIVEFTSANAGSGSATASFHHWHAGLEHRQDRRDNALTRLSPVSRSPTPWWCIMMARPVR